MSESKAGDISYLTVARIRPPRLEVLNVSDVEYLKDQLSEVLYELRENRDARGKILEQLARMDQQQIMHYRLTEDSVRKTKENTDNIRALEQRMMKVEDRMAWWVWLWSGAIFALGFFWDEIRSRLPWSQGK